jgi:AraC-like DNA-binding protein
MTPGAHLGEWRIGVAQSLLRRGKPLQFVADMVGYSSTSVFSGAFRARLGQSPGEWLRKSVTADA